MSGARAHLRSHAAELGLDTASVDDLAVSSIVPTEHNGLTNVYFQQRVNGLDVSGAMVNVAVRPDGSVFRVASSAVEGAAKLANGTTPEISDVRAARAAADALGLQVTGSFASDDLASGVARSRELADGGISQEPIPAHLVYEQAKDGSLRLAWELGIYQLDSQHWWQIRMDARDGSEVGKVDWVAADSHRVYPVPTEAPSFGGRSLVSNPASSASPFGWNDTNGSAGAELTTTNGNNVSAYTDTDANNVPDVGSSPDGGGGLAFDFALDLTQPPSAYRPAAVSNLYFTNNRIHDVLYRYGFTEAAGNFQVNNYGHGGLGADAVNAEAQDGSGTNNANFGTPPDGAAPRMQMYVWTAPTPDRDGDLDNGIIIHEYGHGVSNRLTGGPGTTSCLSGSEQAGEGWSDFLAYMLTMPNGTEPAGGRGIGTYALDQPTTGPGIRQFPYSTSLATNPHTYQSTKTVAVPHGVGSVWAEMLWEMTYALIARHGFSANLEDTSVGGNKISLQLVMDGMKLQPCNPGFVDARNAILAADQADYAGANQCLIWTAFAKRGLGFSAVQGSSSSNADNTEAFDLPPSCLGLTVSRTASPDPAQAGQRLTYGYQIQNTTNPPAALSNVTVTGTVGDHAAFAAGTATCGGSYDSTSKTVTFTLPTLAAGATQSCQFQVDVAPTPFSVLRWEDDLEPDMSGWAVSHGVGTVDWTHATAASHSSSHSAFATDPGAVSDQYLALATPYTVQAGDTLSFWHMRGFEAGFDGGVVEISTDNGASWNDIGEANFVQNGYTHTISTNATYQSPIIGRRAFSGSSGWIRSSVDLGSWVGQAVRVRFRAASDTTVGGTGWNIDDVRVGVDVETTSLGSATATGVGVQPLNVTSRIVAPTVTPPTPPAPPAPPAPTATAPGAPVITSAVAVSPKKAKVSFTLASTGGSPVTSYSVTCTGKKGAKTKTKTGPASPITVKGLTPGKKYTCTVTATNAKGTGPASAKSKKFTMPKGHHRSTRAVVVGRSLTLRARP